MRARVILQAEDGFVIYDSTQECESAYVAVESASADVLRKLADIGAAVVGREQQ